MKQARLIWVPYPYRAGFCITDDCDATDLASFGIVYRFLKDIGLRTTRTVWVYEPEERCGIPPIPPSILRGITLQDPEYLAFCRELKRAGFEFCLHGASAGNNRRQRTMAALEFLDEHLGGSETFICHAKNTDNIYWEHKVAPTPMLGQVLRLYSKHRCSGEVRSSPYFWGDLCREYIRQIRLFRTRNTNTLAENPSMPYFEESKPWVQGWFAATKRSFPSCTTAPALSRLKRESGLTVLYQYLHRYADLKTGTVSGQFRQGAERLVADPGIWTATTTRIMKRLRQIQHLFVLWRNRHCWLVNTSDSPLLDVQLVLPRGVHCTGSGVSLHGRVCRVAEIPGSAVLKLRFTESIRFPGARTSALPAHGHGSIDFGHGRMFANLTDRPWNPHPGLRVEPNRFALRFNPGLEETRPMSRAGRSELYRLFRHQFLIILDEFINKGRSVRTDRFLNAGEIRLEDQSTW